MAATLASAVAKIERHGVMLVFPIENRPEPRSLWSELHPRTRMRWEWDSSGDDRVAALWHLRERLARSGEVVYAKWFRGRATFFARDVFRAMLASLIAAGDLRFGLSPRATAILELLDDDSPQSTKELRARAEMQGRANEAAYARALKELWTRMLVVGAGEVADGAFPSLAVGATRLLFEELWREAEAGPRARDPELLSRTFADAPLFGKELEKARKLVTRAPRAEPSRRLDEGEVERGAGIAVITAAPRGPSRGRR